MPPQPANSDSISLCHFPQRERVGQSLTRGAALDAARAWSAGRGGHSQAEGQIGVTSGKVLASGFGLQEGFGLGAGLKRVTVVSGGTSWTGDRQQGVKWVDVGHCG